MGLPATTINLGALAEAGIVSRNERIAKMFEGAGVHGISRDKVLEEIARITQAQPTQVGLFDVDWDAWSRVFTIGRNSSRFKGLIRSDEDRDGAGLEAKQSEFAGLVGQPLRDAIRNSLTQIVASLLRLSPERVDPRSAITDLGMDSLVASYTAITVTLPRDRQWQVPDSYFRKWPRTPLDPH